MTGLLFPMQLYIGIECDILKGQEILCWGKRSGFFATFVVAVATTSLRDKEK